MKKEIIGQSNSHQPIRKSLFIRINGGYERILLEDIFFFKAEGAYSIVHFQGRGKQQQKAIISYNLASTEKALDERFMRVNRSYIVNLDKVFRIEDVGDLLLEDGHEVSFNQGLKRVILEKFQSPSDLNSWIEEDNPIAG